MFFGFGNKTDKIQPEPETEVEKLEREERERLHSEKEEQLRLKALAEKQEQDRIDLINANKKEQLRRKILDNLRESFAFPKEVPEVGSVVNVILYDPCVEKDKILCFEGIVRSRRNFKEEGFISVGVACIFDNYEVTYIPSTGMWWDYSKKHGQGTRKEAIVTLLTPSKA